MTYTHIHVHIHTYIYFTNLFSTNEYCGRHTNIVNDVCQNTISLITNYNVAVSYILSIITAHI